MSHRRTRFPSLCLLALFVLLGLAARPAAAGQGERGLSPQKLTRELRSRYEKVKKDRALGGRVSGGPGKAATSEEVEAYLRAMPLSPLEYLRMDMQARHYQVVVTALLQEQHVRWVGLHEEEARRLYGDRQVDGWLYGEPERRRGGKAPEGGAGAPAPKALPGNHNLAATAVPDPDEYQGEVQIVANPNNVNQIVAAANSFDAPLAACGNSTIAVLYSTDAGVTWGYTCAPTSTAFVALPACAGFGNVFGSDPALAWNANGEVFLNYMLLCQPDALKQEYWWSVVVARSTDAGATWTAQGIVKSSWPVLNEVNDKNFYTIDRTAGSPYFGRHYVCWDHENDEKFGYSSDNGATWTEVDLPPPGAFSRDVGCDVAVDRQGKVHVIFNNQECLPNGTCFNTRLYYTNSSDGGATWSALRLLRDYNFTEFAASSCPEAQNFRCIGTMGAIDVDRSGGPCDGSIYVTYGDHEPGRTVEDMDVWVQRGTLGGLIWGGAVKVNSDYNPDVEHIQFHPSLAVDQYDGELAVAWYDGRNHANNKLMDVYYATSKDCGATFGNFPLTANSAEFNNPNRTTSNENTVDNVRANPNQYGEYLGVDIQGSKLSIAWTDSRHFYPAVPFEPQKENIAFEQRTLSKVAYVKTYKSIALDDGWVQESSETSNVGDFSSTTDIVAGDNNFDEQRKGILSFDTAAIPEAVTIQSARLKLRRKSLTGSSPYSSVSILAADIKNGTFGLSSLQTSDFEASASAVAICFPPEPLTDGAWTECNVLAAGLAQINKSGKTQLRLYFTLGDNDNLAYDSLAFYGGEAAEADRPQLIVTYF